MKLNKNIKIDAACSTDKTRETLANVKLEGDKLIATDGHIMAVVKVEREEIDADGLIPAQAFKEARRIADKRVTDIHLTANGEVKLTNGATFERSDAQFPDWTKVQPDPDKAPVITIGFDPALLARIVAALGEGESRNGHISLEIRDTTGPIIVRRSYESGDVAADFGLLMPVRL